MNPRNLIISVISSAAIAIAISGCRSQKDAAATSATENIGNGYTKQTPLADRYPTLVDSYKEWATVSVPVKIELNEPKRFSISGRAYMDRDKSVLLSLRMLGLEVATVYIDNDSIFITEKLHKYYVAEDVESLLAGYPVTVGDLQSMLLGQAFVAGKGRIDKRESNMMSLSSVPTGGSWAITPPSPAEGIGYTFTISDSDNRLESLTVTIEDHHPTSVIYTHPAQSPAGAVNGRLEISSHAAKKPISASMKWNFKGAEWNTADLRQWKRPKGYTRLKRSDIINVLSSI